MNQKKEATGKISQEAQEKKEFNILLDKLSQAKNIFKRMKAGSRS